MPNTSPRPGLLLGLIRARARCSRVVPVLVVPCSPALPISGWDGGPTYLSGEGFLPSRKCLGASSPPTPLNGYTFTLFRRHPCLHGRPSIRLQTIHVHYCERLVPFPTHDNSSSIQHLGDECRAEPRELQLRSPCSRTDLSERGRVPPIPEVPGRILTPDSSKRLPIHAVPSSSMPAWLSLDMSPDDPRALLRAACPVSDARQLVLYPTLW